MPHWRRINRTCVGVSKQLSLGEIKPKPMTTRCQQHNPSSPSPRPSLERHKTNSDPSQTGTTVRTIFAGLTTTHARNKHELAFNFKAGDWAHQPEQQNETSKPKPVTKNK